MRPNYTGLVADWLWRVPFCTGIGVGAGIIAAGLLAARRAGVATAALVGIAVGVIVGLLIGNWDEILGGAVGGAAGALGTATIVQGALRRGGTRGGTALLVAAAGLGAAALALVPFVGYLEALALPGFAVRARRRGGERYAGLRTLAKD